MCQFFGGVCWLRVSKLHTIVFTILVPVNGWYMLVLTGQHPEEEMLAQYCSAQRSRSLWCQGRVLDCHGNIGRESHGCKRWQYIRNWSNTGSWSMLLVWADFYVSFLQVGIDICAALKGLHAMGIINRCSRKAAIRHLIFLMLLS